MVISAALEIIMIDIEASMMYCLVYKPGMGVLGMLGETKNVIERRHEKTNNVVYVKV